MPLSDVEIKDAKERLRASNLDDLENAFKEESPLNDSFDDATLEEEKSLFVPSPQSPLPQSRNNHFRFNKEGQGTIMEEESPSSSEDEGGKIKPVKMNDKEIEESSKQSEPLVKDKTVSFSSNEPQDRRYDPFEEFDEEEQNQNNQSTPNVQSFQAQITRQVSRPVLVINGNELNSPQRKTCLAIILLGCAAIGLALAMTRPPAIATLSNSSKETDPCNPSIATEPVIYTQINGTIKCIQPTTSPYPSMSHRPTVSPTVSSGPSIAPVTQNYFDEIYNKVQLFIVDSQVSSPKVLPATCKLPLCSRGESQHTLTVQEKTVHYLLTQDPIFLQWISNNVVHDHAERVLQRYILTLMAFSLNSSWWVSNENWPIENAFVASKDECDWFGLSCETRSSYVHLKDYVDHTFLSQTTIINREVESIPMVTSIALGNNTLIGQLPQEVFKLRHLQELKVHFNELSGSLPNSIGLLSNMQKLWLHDTKHLDGTIPIAIGNMTSLSSLWLGLNKFHGSIPNAIGKLTSLQTLALLGNRLTGSIPKEIENLIDLKNLFLDANRLNGTIPNFGGLVQLEDLRLDNNFLHGTLPYSLSGLKKLKTFYAYKNELEGGLGSSLVVGWESLGK